MKGGFNISLNNCQKTKGTLNLFSKKSFKLCIHRWAFVILLFHLPMDICTIIYLFLHKPFAHRKQYRDQVNHISQLAFCDS